MNLKSMLVTNFLLKKLCLYQKFENQNASYGFFK